MIASLSASTADSASSSTRPNYIGIEFDRLFDRLLRRNIDSDIDYLESGAFQHHSDQILADVVNISLNCRQHDQTFWLGFRFREDRSQNFKAALHGPCRKQHFRHEYRAIGKHGAHLVHGTDQCIVENRAMMNRLIKSLLYKHWSVVIAAIDNRIIDFVQ